MQSFVRFVVGAIVLFLLLCLCLIWSWWLTLFVVLGLIVAAAARYFGKIGGAVGLAILTIGLLAALGYFGVLPSTRRKAEVRGTTTSCASSPTESLLTAVHLTPRQTASSYSGPSGFEQRRLEIERDASRYLFQARRAVDVDVTMTAVSRILDLESAAGLEEARRTVNSGAEDVRKFLNEKDLYGRDQRTHVFADFEQRVRGILGRLKQSTKVEQLDPIAADLFGADNQSMMSQLAQKMFALQESLLALTRQSVEAAPTYSIEWEEGRNLATYRESITIRSRQDALLDRVDASLLKREADTAGISSQFFLQSDNGSLIRVDDPAHILIEPRRKTVTLIYERTGAIVEPVYCSPAPLSTIRRVLFVWPPSSASVRMGGVITKGDEHLPIWFKADRSKPETQFVEDIRL
ncbi:MAG TPA: hypothetical protein VH369_06860, partial [Bryobacteraceae bacterium]